MARWAPQDPWASRESPGSREPPDTPGPRARRAGVIPGTAGATQSSTRASTRARAGTSRAPGKTEIRGRSGGGGVGVVVVVVVVGVGEKESKGTKMETEKQKQHGDTAKTTTRERNFVASSPQWNNPPGRSAAARGAVLSSFDQPAGPDVFTRPPDQLIYSAI